MELLISTVSRADFQLAAWEVFTRFFTFSAAVVAAAALSVYALLFYSEAGGGR